MGKITPRAFGEFCILAFILVMKLKEEGKVN